MDDEQPNNFPYIEIVEQPASKGIRFRYECEGRSAGCIPGENSEPGHRTYPSIRIVGFEGRVVIVVSCVTKDEPYMPHPYTLVGRGKCSQGVFTIQVHTREEPIDFQNLGIQCVKKKEIEDSLKLRKKIRVDPFKTGIDYNIQAIDLSAVRLCFQVFLEGRNGKFHIPLKPVVTNTIYDKKSTNDLVICKLSHTSAPTNGGMEMILLCEKVVKDNIQIVFYEMQNDRVYWQALAKFTPGDVHKQTAIVFRTPRYPTMNVTNPLQVYIQLRRPSDGTTSEPMSFTLIPLETVHEIANSLKRKRQKFNTSGLMDSQIYNQPCYKPTGQNQEGNTAATPNITTSNEDYRVKLLKQLQTKTQCRKDIEIIDKQLNQRNVLNNENGENKPEAILKNVAPSIFPARFTYNVHNKWNNTNNQTSQMPSNQSQNINISNHYQNRAAFNQYQNRDTLNEFENQDMSVEYQNSDVQQRVVQPNPRSIPTVPEQLSMPPVTSASLGFPLLPIRRQNEQINNENQEPTLYRIQKPLTENNILDNIQSPMDFNSNNLNFDVNPLDVLKEFNSEDLARLSETFSTSFSLADPIEFEKIKNL